MAAKIQRINTSLNNLQKVIKKSQDEKNFVEIEISKIKSPHYHDRKYIDKNAILDLAVSIETTKGLIYPIVVRELEDGTYERIIGYRRIEAYKLLDKEKIEAIILKNVSDKEALLLMTTENMQRKNLSVYDETLAIIDYIAVSIEKTPEEVIKFLNRIKNFRNGVLKQGIEDDEKQIYYKIEGILQDIGNITVSALLNRVRQTNVHELLKTELSKGSITFIVAQILNKLYQDTQDENLLQQAIQEVIKNNYSKRETQKYINDLLNKNGYIKTDELLEYKNKLKKISRAKIDKLDDEQKQQFQMLLDEMIKIIS